jgi:hypothetical protein
MYVHLADLKRKASSILLLHKHTVKSFSPVLSSSFYRCMIHLLANWLARDAKVSRESIFTFTFSHLFFGTTWPSFFFQFTSTSNASAPKAGFKISSEPVIFYSIDHPLKNVYICNSVERILSKPLKIIPLPSLSLKFFSSLLCHYIHFHSLHCHFHLLADVQISLT